MKTIFAALILAAFGAGAFCADFSEYEMSLVNQALQIRLESRTVRGDKKALDWLGKKRDEFFSSIKNGPVSQEAALALENFFVLEQYHFMWEIDSKAKTTDDFILNQFNKVSEWNSLHPPKTRSEWYEISSYEVINAAMPLLKHSKKISLGLEEKKFYDSMIKNKSEIGALYLNAGLWYAFAPAIGGGSDSKAKECFLTAANVGASDYEKFFAHVYLSQIDFKKGDSSAWKEDLDEADIILPGNVYTDFVRRLNGAGLDAFEYANDKDGVIAKMNKHYEKKSGKK